MASRSSGSSESLLGIDYILALIILLLIAIIVGVLVLNSSEQGGSIGVPATVSGSQLLSLNSPTAGATATAPVTPVPSSTLNPTTTSPPAPALDQIATVTPVAFVASNAPPPVPLRQFKDSTINIVLIGSDSRSQRSVGRSDVLIVASIDPDALSLTLLSIPRDLWVYVPNWRWERINVVDAHGELSQFSGGGPGLLKQTIQYNLGIPIDYFVRVDFTGFKQLIDTVGGVDVIAACPLYDEFPDVADGQNDILSGSALQSVPVGSIDIPVAGVYHLDGKHALWYARSRSSSNDFARSRRQQQVLRGLWNAIQRQGLVSQVPALWDSLTRMVDTDLTLNDVLFLTNIGTQTFSPQMRSRFLDGSVLYGFRSPSGASVLGYDFNVLNSYLDEVFAPLPANISAQAATWVEVQNGTTHADWDLVAVDRLNGAGYNVQAWSKADVLYPQTVLIDYSVTPKGSRVDELAQLFSVVPQNIIAQPDPNSAVAHRVIVGQDFNPCKR